MRCTSHGEEKKKGLVAIKNLKREAGKVLSIKKLLIQLIVRFAYYGDMWYILDWYLP